MGTYEMSHSKKKLSNRGSENRTNYRDWYDVLAKSFFHVLAVSTKGSLQKRKIRVLLVNGIQTKQELSVCYKNNGHSDISNSRSKSLVLKDLQK